MSFVGPRPIRPRFFAELAHDLPAYWQRLVVRPGLTGFAQVRRGYETSMAEKLAHDLEWIADRSVRLYLRTLFVDRRPGARPGRSAAAPRLGPHVRDLRDRQQPRRRRPRAAPAHVGDARPPRARLRGDVPRRRRSGSPRGGSRSSTSTGGDQPIANEDGTVVVVQNGEIYNYRELTHELERAGHRFRTPLATPRCSSTPTRSGALGFAERLRGMFAVAIWDARERRLVLARDRFGIKPLYYRDVDGELSFASELDALPQGELDLDALEAFLAFNVVPAPLSIFQEIRKLPPGHTLTWHDGRASLERFARPGPLPPRHDEDEAELRRGVPRAAARLGARAPRRRRAGRRAALGRRRLGRAHRARRRGVVGGGADVLDRLRGGVVRRARRRAGGRASATARATASSSLRPDAALLLPALADAFDEPFADSSALPTYLVSKLAAEDVKVALSGEGGDELFGGYYTYVADLLAERVRAGSPRARGRSVERLPSSTRKASFDYRAKRFVRAAAPAAARAPPRLEGDLRRRRARRADRARAAASTRSLGYRARFAETEGHELLTRLQDVDFGGYLVDDLLVKTDRASMAWSLEARVPFLDTVVANFAFSLPARHKVRGFSKKRLLRKAVEPLLPREVVHGRKRGFSIPAAAWLRGELEPFARETLSAETLRRQGYLQPAAVTRVLDEHVSGREDLSRQLWGLLAFTLWYERHVEGITRDVSLESVVAMRVWIDMTASAHPLVFRPLVAAARGAGATRSRSRRATTRRRCS